MLVASMNPCPCGYYGSNIKKCSCTETRINRYLNKISGPLLDRIDIHMEVKPVEFKEFEKETIAESSKEIKKRVNNARKIQLERYKDTKIFSNSELTPSLIEKYCKLDNTSKKILKMAFENMGLSARAYNKILKVSRTIADLEEEKNILSKHIAEAIQYRNLDQKYWSRNV